jgi:hypothetical protein
MGILWYKSEEPGQHPVDYVGRAEDGEAEFHIESPRSSDGARAGYFVTGGPTSREYVADDVNVLKQVAESELTAPAPAPAESRNGGGGGGLLLLALLGLGGYAAYKVFFEEPKPAPQQLPPQPQPYVPGR